MAAAKAAGSFLGGIFNNPGIIAIAAIGITLFIFRDRISEFFAGLKFPEFPTIEFPEFPEFPTIEFPEFPEFPDFGSFFDNFFDNFFNGNDEEPTFTEEPTEEPTVLPGGPGIGPVEFPPGCFINSQGQLDCPTPPTFDVCLENPELCEGPPPEPGDDDFIGPVQPDEPFSLDTFFDDTPPVQPPFMPPVDLPPGFTGSGPSFEGGTIFERDPCFMSLNEIINAGLASSASAAADLKAIACSANVTVEPTDFPEEFEFGTSTGSGIFGPPTGEENIITGGATLESEEKKAACVTCELFGLNCPICSGTI